MEERTPVFRKGHKFDDGFGAGYELTRDVFYGETPMPSMFEPYGGAKNFEIGGRIPQWLDVQLFPNRNA